MDATTKIWSQNNTMTAKPKIRICDIAARSGVSTATVSRVMNGHYGHSPRTVDQVRSVIQELTDEQLRMKQNGEIDCVGIFLITYDNFLGSFYTGPLISAVIEHLTKAGIAVQLLTVMEQKIDFAAVERQIRQFGVKGVIALEFYQNYQIVSQLSHLDIPVVSLGNSQRTGMYAVCNDDENAGRRAAAVLWSRGHRRLGILDMKLSNRVHAARHRGFVEEAIRLGADPEIWHWEYQSVDDLLESTVVALQNSIRRPTALFSTDSTICAKLYQVLQASPLRVPEDISLLSFESNGELAGWGVSVMCEPVRQMGFAAAAMIAALIHGEEPPQERIVFNCFLKSRKSILDMNP